MENFWYKILRVVLYAILLTPLWISGAFLFPFITTKILYFRILVELALVLYIPLAIMNPDLRPRKSWLTGATWLYVFLILVTSFFGFNFAKSFWGTVERGEGILTILHFAVYATMLAGVFRKASDWYRYMFAALLSTLLVCAYSVLQLVGFPGVIHSGAGRISGSIGNPAFFAAFLIFGMFLAIELWRLTAKEKVRSRRFFLAAFCFQLGLLYVTETRGAVLAVVGVVVIYLFIKVFISATRRARVLAILGLLFLMIVAGGVYMSRGKGVVGWSHTARRLATISRSDVTTQSRLDAWSASWPAFLERPLIGYGYENYNIAFNKYFPPRIYKKNGSQVWFDRAHNVVIDITLTSGLVGLLGYMGIFAAAFWVAAARRLLPVGLLLAAYFFQNLFVFDTQATYLMFFLVLGYLSFLEKAEDAPVVNRRLPHGASVVALVVFFFVAYFFNLKPALANHAATTGIKAGQAGEFLYAKERFEKALSYGTYMDEEFRYRLADYAMQAASQLSPDEQADLFSFAIAELKKNVASSPRDARNYAYLVTVMNRANPVVPGLTSETLDLTRAALDLSSTRQQIYFELGQALIYGGDKDGALAAFAHAVDLNPETKESRLSYLSAAILLGRTDIAEKQTELLDVSGRLTAADYVAIGDAYYRSENIQKTIENYRRAVEMQPQSPELRGKLAAAYGLVCDLPKAKEEVAMAVALDSNYRAAADQFFRELAERCKK